MAPGAAFLVDGDEPRLRQVIGNLVNNALTHTPPGTPVRVKIASAPSTPAGSVDGHGGRDARREPVPAVVLDVEDDGPGMNATRRSGSSSGSTAPTRPGTARPAAPASGWRSSPGWWPRTAARCPCAPRPGEGADFQVKLPLSPDARVGEPGDADDEDSPASAR